MNRTFQLTPGVTRHPRGVEQDAPLVRTDRVYVVYTSAEETLAAVHVAAGIAKSLGVPVSLIHFRTVPYALPLEEPNGVDPVERDAFTDRLREAGVDVRIRVYLCSSERQSLPLALKPHSLIVLAGRRRWWLGRPERRLRRMLEAAGYFVLFVDTSLHGDGGRQTTDASAVSILRAAGSRSAAKSGGARA
jgi:hypothetical protein